MNKKIKVLISEDKIQTRINELATTISSDYKSDIFMICILKGASFFAVDLSKKIKNNVVIDFMKVSSYGDSKESSGKIEFNLDISQDIKDKDVIIIEDIIDTGITLNYLYNYLKAKSPKSLKICALLDKKQRRKESIIADYIGFEIEDKFVVGYGLDYAENYRNLPYIGYIE